MKVAAVAVRHKRPSSRLEYYALLCAMDCRIDRLARMQDPRQRLIGGVELLSGILSFAEELNSRFWRVRGVLELEAKVD